HRAHRSCLLHRFRALFTRLVMRFHLCRNRSRPSRDVHCDLPPQILPGQVVVARFRNTQSISHKNRLRDHASRSTPARHQIRFVAELHFLRFSTAHQRQRRLRFVELHDVEFHRLRVTVHSRRLQPCLTKFFFHVRRRLLESCRARAASFELVVREILHVRPPAFPWRRPIRRRCLGHRTRAHRKQSSRHHKLFSCPHATSLEIPFMLCFRSCGIPRAFPRGTSRSLHAFPRRCGSLSAGQSRPAAG